MVNLRSPPSLAHLQSSTSLLWAMDRHYVYKECQKTSARLLMVLDWCSTIARRDGNSGIMTTIHQVDRSLKRDHYDKLTHRSADMELCPRQKSARQSKNANPFHSPIRQRRRHSNEPMRCRRDIHPDTTPETTSSSFLRHARRRAGCNHCKEYISRQDVVTGKRIRFKPWQITTNW